MSRERDDFDPDLWDEQDPQTLPQGWFGQQNSNPFVAPPKPTPPPTGGGGATGGADGSNSPNMDPPGYSGGYWMGGKWVRGEPRSTGGPGGFGDGDFGGGMPQFGWPSYQGYGPFTPRESTLTLDPFTPSSWADAENEPGYRDSQSKLQKQVEQGAAFQGMLRSGMTFDRLSDVLTNYGQQNFTNFDNRRFRNWQGNNDRKTTMFGVNLGVDRDIYDRGATENDRGNNYRFNVASKEFEGNLQRWLEKIRSLTSLAQPPG